MIDNNACNACAADAGPTAVVPASGAGVVRCAATSTGCASSMVWLPSWCGCPPWRVTFVAVCWAPFAGAPAARSNCRKMHWWCHEHRRAVGVAMPTGAGLCATNWARLTQMTHRSFCQSWFQSLSWLSICHQQLISWSPRPSLVVSETLEKGHQQAMQRVPGL
eukprot:464897-Pelagomonas_calceolata.AAC.11